MAEKIKINETGDCIYTEQDAIDLLYTNPIFDISKLYFDDPKQYNISIMDTGLPFKKLQSVPSRPSPKVFDADMINNWYMPIKYSKIDVKDYLLKKMSNTRRT